MFKNSILNAFGASAYIVFVVTVMNFISKNLGNKPDTFFAPVVFLSLLTLSVAVMAFMFFYQPLQMFIEGKKKEAIHLFFQTIGVFGAITVVALALLFLGLI